MCFAITHGLYSSLRHYCILAGAMLEHGQWLASLELWWFQAHNQLLYNHQPTQEKSHYHDVKTLGECLTYHQGMRGGDLRLTHWDRDKMAAISQRTISNAFFNENIQISIKISLKFVPRSPIDNKPALVQIMSWRQPGDKPLSEPMSVSSPMQICVNWPQCVNSIHQTLQGQPVTKPEMLLQMIPILQCYPHKREVSDNKFSIIKEGQGTEAHLAGG